MDVDSHAAVVLGHSSRHPQPSCPAMPTAQTDGQCWVRPAGMSDGHPDRPIVHPSVQSLLGTERWMWTVVLGHSSRHSQPSCPAMPTAQTDGMSLGPDDRAARRPSKPPESASNSPVSTGKCHVEMDVTTLCPATRLGAPTGRLESCVS